MLPGDPQQRAGRLAEVMEILGREAAPEDRELVLGFAPLASRTCRPGPP